MMPVLSSNLQLLILFIGLAGSASCQSSEHPHAKTDTSTTMEENKNPNPQGNPQAASFSDQQWRNILSPEQYHVLREKGTERAFTGEYWNHHDNGDYTCAGCGALLFSSDTKFDSGCGWPSFFDMADSSRIIRKEDYSFGMHRIEVICANCKGHLGHVFEDGPQPTGLRYCINSVSIKFKKKP
jgi:peptide-methionine (R)-S-oxide reductase